MTRPLPAAERIAEVGTMTWPTSRRQRRVWGASTFCAYARSAALVDRAGVGSGRSVWDDDGSDLVQYAVQSGEPAARVDDRRGRAEGERGVVGAVEAECDRAGYAVDGSGEDFGVVKLALPSGWTIRNPWMVDVPVKVPVYSTVAFTSMIR